MNNQINSTVKNAFSYYIRFSDQDKIYTYRNEIFTDQIEIFTDQNEIITDQNETFTNQIEICTDQNEIFTDRNEICSNRNEIRTDQNERKKIKQKIYIYNLHNVYIDRYIDLLETQYYGDLIYIIETTLWRSNYGDLILWKLYYTNLIMATIYIVYSILWRPNKGDLILW